MEICILCSRQLAAQTRFRASKMEKRFLPAQSVAKNKTPEFFV
jgi:hypothetical protein